MSGDKNAPADLGFDPAQVAERIKERVRQKMAAGLYDEKEVRKLEDINLRLYEHHSQPQSEHLRFMEDNWDVSAPTSAVSLSRGLMMLL